MARMLAKKCARASENWEEEGSRREKGRTGSETRVGRLDPISIVRAAEQSVMYVGGGRWDVQRVISSGQVSCDIHCCEGA